MLLLATPGRQFYKCAKPQGTGCDFFLWADQLSPPSTTNSHSAPHFSSAPPPPSPQAQSGRQPGFLSTSNSRGTRGWQQRGGRGQGGVASDSSASVVVVCHCEEEAVLRTVQKDGPNKGKQFYTCPKPREQQCRFFEWADSMPGSSVRKYSTRGGRGRGRGGANSWRTTHGADRDGGGGGAGREGGTGARKRAPPTCGVCREVGHTRRTCPQLK